MKVILFSGKARHGKDTAADMVNQQLKEKGYKVQVIHYADLLKYICKTYFGWNGEKDEAGRTILQYVGTDIVRKKDENFWVKFVIKFLQMFENEWDYVLIPDCRFPNEVDVVRGFFNTAYIKVIRTNFISPLTIEQQNHISETALDNTKADYELINDSDLENLSEKVKELVNKLCI